MLGRASIALTLAAAAVSAQDCCPHNPEACPVDVMKDLTLKEGFCLDVFADQVLFARGLSVAHTEDPDLGDVVFVGTLGNGYVHAVVDKDRDGHADNVVKLYYESFRAGGVAFDERDGALYIKANDRLLRINDVLEYVRRDLEVTEPQVMFDRFSNERYGYHEIKFGPDGNLYLMMGAPCDVCVPKLEPCDVEECHFAEMTTMEVFGKDSLVQSDIQTVLVGQRDSVGFDFDPADEHVGDIWFTDCGSNEKGADLPPDELNYVPAGQRDLDFGFPYCFGTGVPDPAFNDDGDCSAFEDPILELPAHSSSLGMTFYRTQLGNETNVTNPFPVPYDQGIYLAEHGSIYSRPFVGARILHVGLEWNEQGRPVPKEEVLLDGFLTNPEIGIRTGRPVDITQLSDGSLIFSDDYSMRIYRIHKA